MPALPSVSSQASGSAPGMVPSQLVYDIGTVVKEISRNVLRIEEKIDSNFEMCMQQMMKLNGQNTESMTANGASANKGEFDPSGDMAAYLRYDMAAHFQRLEKGLCHLLSKELANGLALPSLMNGEKPTFVHFQASNALGTNVDQNVLSPKSANGSNFDVEETPKGAEFIGPSPVPTSKYTFFWKPGQDAAPSPPNDNLEAIAGTNVQALLDQAASLSDERAAASGDADPAPAAQGIDLEPVPGEGAQEKQALVDSQDAAAEEGAEQAAEEDKPERGPSSALLERQSSGFLVDEGMAAPQRAFVVNHRRLIKVQEKLTLLHEFIDSTAIAALTLVAAATMSQFLFTMIFLFATLVLFTMHHQGWDTLDIDDLQLLLPLLSDDKDQTKPWMENPNRLLKCLSANSSHWGNYKKHLIHVICLVSLIIGWLIMFRFWSLSSVRRLAAKGGGGEGLPEDFEASDFIDSFIVEFFGKEDDSITMGMQMTVISLFFVLHVIFDTIMNFEFSAIMPDVVNEGCRRKEVWDPRVHGVPRKYALTGLPSMWFTSQETIQDLMNFISYAQKEPVVELKQQEIALLVLSGDESNAEVRHTLTGAKLYNAAKGCFVEDGHGHSSLSIDVVLFDNQHHSNQFDYPGEFARFTGDDEE